MDSITKIEGTAKHGADYQFRVEMTDGTETIECVVAASELTSYSAFQRAILSRLGRLFRDDDFATPRLGASYWQDEVQRHLDASRKAGRATE